METPQLPGEQAAQEVTRVWKPPPVGRTGVHTSRSASQPLIFSAQQAGVLKICIQLHRNETEEYQGWGKKSRKKLIKASRKEKKKINPQKTDKLLSKTVTGT